MKRLIAGLIVVHRYLGVAFCLVFLIWFASGIVMIFKRMPEFSQQERLARLPLLDAQAIRLTPAQALEAAGLGSPPERALLTTYRGRPVYRFGLEVGSITVSAADGASLEIATPEDAVEVAGLLFPEHRATARYVGSIGEPDQWTITNRFDITGALHRVALGDAAGTDVYVAEATGEVVMKTDRAGRFWGYLGPVAHWFYFTPLRWDRAPLWNDLIVYGSVVGCVLCVLGLVLGLYRVSLTRRFMHGTSVSPYVGWMRWHHYAGLLFGAAAFTWTFSGLLTMTPWNLFPPAGPSLEQLRAVRGDGVAVDRFTVSPAAAIVELQRRFAPKEIELLQFMGAPFYAAYQRAGASGRAHQEAARFAPADAQPRRVLVSADGTEPAIREAFARDQLVAAARAAMGGLEPFDAAWLGDYDAYYYNRTGGRRLPVLRTKFNDARETWLYFDATDGSIALAEVRGSRTERWLYQGLHSLDFPWLYARPSAWYIVIIGLSAGGVALSLTSIGVAWRFLRGKARPAAEQARLTRIA
ncbi:MAG: hypothetical protein A3I61_18400 [Acidobacteria bacterium RIFCSPLOWO2_02_FULL_68_18]|nr:MAG: hypothetical protein A3I61_18400 [Acidobacteria bacterium RIFCSPLOWO2_02_FULL_68_18]OFW48023.1 MAG: hypothetical protein A3G77_11015 [Acidobacteria bacterium RIFCSPLOWO2_12_FULL_68_19]